LSNLGKSGQVGITRPERRGRLGEFPGGYAHFLIHVSPDDRPHRLLEWIGNSSAGSSNPAEARARSSAPRRALRDVATHDLEFVA
jgi:hypothetical protein